MKHFGVFLAFLFLAATAQAGVRGQLRQGGKFYNDQKYGSALNSYQEILKEDPNNQQALFNAGNAYYRLNDYTLAEETYKQAAQAQGDLSQSALFNLGNAYYRAGDRQKAIESYKAAVLKNPKDKEAIHNLQLAMQQEQQQNNNQNNNNNQNQSSDNQNQQNQDNKGQAPQEEQQENDEEQNRLDKSAADRVMSMAKENEYRRSASSNRQPDQTVEKDW